jgi:polyketide cyclase/dehydrase/lipid transport protein
MYQVTKLLNTAVALLILWSPVMSAPTPASQVRSFRLEAPPARVMPLFTAEGERSWAPGWEPVILSGEVERGSAFVTRAHSGIETTWIVIDYRPAEGRASYARLAQGSNIGLVDVSCTAAEDGGTVVTVRYTLTGVSEQGRAFVREFLEPQHYARMIDEWRVATSAALAKQPVSH